MPQKMALVIPKLDTSELDRKTASSYAKR